MKVLMAEEDKDTGILYKRALEARGHQVEIFPFLFPSFIINSISVAYHAAYFKPVFHTKSKVNTGKVTLSWNCSCC
jgi:hypothetical protein